MGIAYTKPESGAAKGGRSFRQFDSVRLLEDLPASAVMFLDDEITLPIIAAGATGAIVDVYDHQHGFYEVELTEPVPALVTLRGSQIELR